MFRCNICGGKEWSLGPNGRRAINGSLPLCVGCGSLERHRIVRKVWDSVPREVTINKKLLQFSNDPSLDFSRFGCFELSLYNSDNSLDLMNINREDECYDIVVLNHVLEHVLDDNIAFQEVHRIINDNGFCQFTVPDPVNNPFTEDWGYPDENNHGHYRIYGSDLIQRLCAGSDIDVIFLRMTEEVTENEDIVYFSSRCRQVLIDLGTWFLRGLNIVPETSWTKKSDRDFANMLTPCSELEDNLCENGDQVAFSVIMPTFNRRHCIARAINSVLVQDYLLYEIIIIDDGSSDGTCDYLESQYPREIMENKIVLVRQQNFGVSVARNTGIQRARYDWICYLDTDNQMKDGFFRTYCKFIKQFPCHKCFYSKIIHKRSQLPIGRAFDLPELLIGNYIDMNSFVHANMYPDEYWLFNADLTRLVDYDVILKFCSRYEPLFIDKILVCYDDSESQERITNSADLQSNLSIIRNSEIRIEVKRLHKEFTSLKEVMRNSFQERDVALQERDVALQERDAALQERDAALQERDAALQERDAMLVSPYWRVTEPVRTFLASKPGIRTVLKKILRLAFRSILIAAGCNLLRLYEKVS
jgi:hypothetical protein